MLKELLLLALATLCASEGLHITGKTADMDFLHKQKKIYELLFFVKQNTLTDMEFYEIGRNYDIESSIDMYKDKVSKLRREMLPSRENQINVQKTSEGSQSRRYSLKHVLLSFSEFLHTSLFINLSSHFFRSWSFRSSCTCTKMVCLVVMPSTRRITRNIARRWRSSSSFSTAPRTSRPSTRPRLGHVSTSTTASSRPPSPPRSSIVPTASTWGCRHPTRSIPICTSTAT